MDTLSLCPQVLEQHNALLDAADKFREELPAEVADCCRHEGGGGSCRLRPTPNPVTPNNG